MNDFSHRSIIQEFNGKVFFVSTDETHLYQEGFRLSSMNELETCGTLYGVAEDLDDPNSFIRGRIIVASDGVIVLKKVVTGYLSYSYSTTFMRGDASTLEEVNKLVHQTGIVSFEKQNEYELIIAKTADLQTLD